VTAQIPNHSIAGATGTYLLLQAASTTNPGYDPQGNGTGGSILRDSIKVYDATNQLLDTSVPLEVFRTFYTSNYPLFGGVGYEEVAWQVFVPGAVGDFKVTADVMVHASLQAIRIDSLVAVPAVQPGDYDGDNDVDGADFVVWQTNFPSLRDAMPGHADGDRDGDVDGADFVIWQTNFPFSPGGGASPVPEPHAVMLLALGGLLALFRHRLTRRI
jgi:MYXO-CTERM domain-containing protein